jgi:hypothetical protein
MVHWAIVGAVAIGIIVIIVVGAFMLKFACDDRLATYNKKAVAYNQRKDDYNTRVKNRNMSELSQLTIERTYLFAERQKLDAQFAGLQKDCQVKKIGT